MNQQPYLWLISVRNREAFNEGNTSLSRKRGFASISFLSSESIMFLADLVSPYFDNCSFSLHLIKSPCLKKIVKSTYQISQLKPKYLKLSRVKRWVISLNNSSLNAEKTFKSFTNISTAFTLSFLSTNKKSSATESG